MRDQNVGDSARRLTPQLKALEAFGTPLNESADQKTLACTPKVINIMAFVGTCWRLWAIVLHTSGFRVPQTWS